ncbi:MAG: chloride channel protein [Candidatus Odinarchaeia archaeon]
MEARRFKSTVSAVEIQVGRILRWVLIGGSIGLVLGLASIAFREGIIWISTYMFQFLPGSLIFLAPMFGLFLSGLVRSIEGKCKKHIGHDVDLTIDAYHNNWGRVKFRSVPIAFTSAILTLGTGGSAGPEGPSIQIGAGIASQFRNPYKLKLYETKLIVLCGIAASLSAIFQAPITGCLFACEIMYARDLEYNAIFPTLISSLVSYAVSAYFFGHILGHKFITFTSPFYQFNILDLPVFLILGVLVGIIGLVFMKCMRFVSKGFKKIDLPIYVKTLIGGGLTGLTAFIIISITAFPVTSIMGIGEETIQFLLEEPIHPIHILALILMGKIIATSFTLESGAGGGVVAPALIMGATVGSLVSTLFGFNPAGAMVVIGAVAMLASIAHTPIAGSLMAGEMFGLGYIIPATLCCFIGSMVAMHESVYTNVLVDRSKKEKIAVKYRYV